MKPPPSSCVSQSKAKRKRPSLSSPIPMNYNLDPSVAQTIKPKIPRLYLSRARDLLGAKVEIITANPEISIVDHCSAEKNPLEVGVHFDSVKCGLCFPLHPFMSEFFNAHKIIPAQLAPNGYNFLVVFLNVCKECNIPPSLSLFHYLFNVVAGTVVENESFVIISPRRGLKFVTKLRSSHSGWKERFFKVKLPASDISFVNVWSTRFIYFGMPEKTPELLSQVKKITSVDRSCIDYASKVKIEILYGPKAQRLLIAKDEVEEEPEKIKGLEGRQAGVDEFKKSEKQFHEFALEYIHNNLEAFVGWELADEARREAVLKIVEANNLYPTTTQ